MLSVFLVPIVLRPLDFIFNFTQYAIGFFSYMFLLPVFINIMQVYSIANLHDISWGNRPSASGGTNMLSNDAKKQQELKTNYMVFRANFLGIWLILNALFVILIRNFVGSGSFILGFSILLATMVIFRVGFAIIHIISMKFKRICQF